MALIQYMAPSESTCRNKRAVIRDTMIDAIVRVARMRSGIPVTIVRMFSPRLCRYLMESA